MKLFFLFFLLITQAYAGNAVLLTSLELPSGKMEKLEKKFKEAFEHSDLTPIIHHRVGPELLLETMKSEDSEVILWVSHAAGEKELQVGVGAEDIILDIHGNDVKKFFTSPSKNLRFLGIVGCQAQSIIDGFKARGQFQNQPELEIMSFQKKVELFSGFKKTLERSKEVLARSLEATEKSEAETLQFYVTRTPSKASGWIELGDKVVSYFTSSDKKVIHLETYDYELWTSINNKNMKFIRDLEKKSAAEDLGKLSFSIHANLGSWKLFATANGKALGGLNQQLYIYKP
jgi:hypothetical protein